ncbi:hypothetical protein C8R43DRAFT_950526 [Mycena crocata]|nr:hypothetical protein C8R43DRAFT_950526 [Mycena crocata]
MDAVATCRRSVFIGWAYVPVLTIVQLNELDNIMVCLSDFSPRQNRWSWLWLYRTLIPSFSLTSVTAQEKLSVVLDDVPTFAPPVGHPIYSAHYGVLEDMAGTLVGFFTCTPPSRGVFSFLPGSSTFLVTFRAGKASVAPSSTTATRELGEPLGTLCDFIPRKYSAGDQMDTVVVCPREHYGLLERLFTSQPHCQENIRYIMVCLTLFRWTSNDSAHYGAPEKYLDPTFHLRSTSSQRFLVSAGFLYIFGHLAGEQLNDGDLDDDDEMSGSGRRSFASCTHAIRDLGKLSFKALVDRFDACPRKALGHPTVIQQSMSVGVSRKGVALRSLELVPVPSPPL